MSTFRSVAQAIESSLVITQAQRTEGVIRSQGSSHLFTVISNLAQTASCISLVNRAFHALKWAPLSITTRGLIYATPMILTLEVMQHFLPGQIHFIADFIYNHLNDVYQVAAVVSSIAVLFFDHPAVGAASLCILSIGVLDQHGILPREWMQGWTLYPFYAAMGLNLLATEHMLRSVSALTCSFLYQYLGQDLPAAIGFDIRHRKGIVTKPPTTQITYKMLSGGKHIMQIHRNYMYYRPIVNVPAFDLCSMIDQFKAINWEGNNVVILRKKLSRDPRFFQQYNRPSLASDDEMIKFATQHFEELICSVIERRVLGAESADYQRFENYLKIIGHRLQNQDPLTIRRALLSLALDRESYSVAGRFKVIESVYMSIVFKGDDSRPLVDIFADYLRYRRTEFFIAKSFQMIREISLSPDLIDVQVIHNMFMNMWGPVCGVYSEAAHNDKLAQPPVPIVWGIDCFIKSQIVDEFCRQHRNVQGLIDWIEEGLLKNELSKERVYEFLHEWIQRQTISFMEKNLLTQNLKGTPPRFMNAIVEENGRINRFIITMILWEIGILEPWTFRGKFEPNRGMVRFLAS